MTKEKYDIMFKQLMILFARDWYSFKAAENSKNEKLYAYFSNNVDMAQKTLESFNDVIKEVDDTNNE